MVHSTASGQMTVWLYALASRLLDAAISRHIASSRDSTGTLGIELLICRLVWVQQHA